MTTPPSYETSLLYWPWVVIRFRCPNCPRARDSRLAACAARYGAHMTMGELLAIFKSHCPRSPELGHVKPQKYGLKCTATIADIGSNRPPDMPQPVGLKLVAEERVNVIGLRVCKNTF